MSIRHYLIIKNKDLDEIVENYQIFEVTRGLYPQYIDWSGNIRDDWELIFECF